jgi:PAS domain S-box-containing protein
MTAKQIATYAAALLVIGITYFALAKLGLTLASVHPSATPIWPPTGFALAVVLLWGYRIWPAIFLGALFANATTYGSLTTSLAIATGNTLESIVGGYLIAVWAGGRTVFETPSGVAKFALISLFPSAAISATVGVVSLSLAGYAEWATFIPVWATWWLGDLAGALVITPVIVIWATSGRRALDRQRALEGGAVLIAAGVVGLVAFSPLLPFPEIKHPLAFTAVLPLLWAALRHGQRETATVALVLSGFAIWGAVDGAGPFAQPTPNESFLLLLAFMVSVSVPALALSADVAVRRRAETIVRDQEQDLRAIISQSITGIAQVDTTGRYIFVNQRFSEIVQRPIPELLQLRMQDITHPDDLPHNLELFERARTTGEGYIIEKRNVRPDGSIVWVRNQVSAIYDQAGNVRHIVAVSEDITDRRRADESLRRAHEDLERKVQERTIHLQRAYESLHLEVEERKRIEAELRQREIHLLEAQSLAQLGSWTWDIPRNRVTWSKQLFGIFGLRPEDARGTYEDYLERVHDDDRAPVKTAIDVALRMGTRFEHEARIVRPDGEIRHLLSCGEVIRDERGNPLQMLGICQDITDRKKAENALRESEERYRLMVASVRNYAIFMLDREGRVVSWNEAAMRILGYDESEILGQHFSVFYPPARREDEGFVEKLDLAHRLGRHEEEGQRVRRDGTQFWASVVMAPIRDHAGPLRGFVTVVRDLTQHKEAEQKLKDYAERLKIISRRVLDIQEIENRNLARELHDEIGQALTALKLNLMALAGSAPSIAHNDSLRESIDIVDNTLRQIRNLSLDLRPTVLDDLGLEAALRWFAHRQANRAGFAVTVTCDPVPDDVPGDLKTACFRIAQQALTNVVRHARASRVNVRLHIRRGWMILTVRDNGRGFDVADAMKNAARGQSFGLLSMQERASLANGTFEIQSASGKGTVVHAHLPFRAIATPNAEAPAVPGNAGRRASRRRAKG